MRNAAQSRKTRGNGLPRRRRRLDDKCIRLDADALLAVICADSKALIGSPSEKRPCGLRARFHQLTELPQ